MFCLREIQAVLPWASDKIMLQQKPPLNFPPTGASFTGWHKAVSFVNR
jgi:hypothetical protein